MIDPTTCLLVQWILITSATELLYSQTSFLENVGTQISKHLSVDRWSCEDRLVLDVWYLNVSLYFWSSPAHFDGGKKWSWYAEIAVTVECIEVLYIRWWLKGRFNGNGRKEPASTACEVTELFSSWQLLAQIFKEISIVQLQLLFAGWLAAVMCKVGSFLSPFLSFFYLLHSGASFPSIC